MRPSVEVTGSTFGWALAKAILRGRLRDLVVETLGAPELREPGLPVDFRLSISPEYSHWPWEQLRLGPKEPPLAARPWVRFARRFPVAEGARHADRVEPRVLLLHAPTTAFEASVVQDHLQLLGEVWGAQRVDALQLQDWDVSEQRWSIVHVLCHGSPGTLLLSKRPAFPTELAAVATSVTGALFLGACWGAADAGSEWGSVADGLARHGARDVVAFARKVFAADERHVAETWHRCMAAGASAGRATSEVRTSLQRRRLFERIPIVHFTSTDLPAGDRDLAELQQLLAEHVTEARLREVLARFPWGRGLLAARGQGAALVNAGINLLLRRGELDEETLAELTRSPEGGPRDELLRSEAFEREFALASAVMQPREQHVVDEPLPFAVVVAWKDGDASAQALGHRLQAALGQDNGVVQGEGPGVPTFVHVLGAGGPNPPVARETFHILLGSAELGDPTRRCVLPSKPSMPPTGVRVRLLEEVAAAAAVHHALATKKIWVHLDRALVLHPQSVAAVHVDGVELVADTRELCSDSSVLVLPDRLSEPALRRALEAAAAGVPIVYVAVGTADTAVDPRPPGARVRIPAADIPGIYLIIDAAVTTRMRASHGAWRVRQLHVPEARTLLVPPSRFVRVEGAQTLLYPDPPLGTAAAEAAGVAHCRLLTPGTLNLVRASKPVVVGLSFSIPEHPANAGWEGPHLQDLQVQLARSLVLAGHTVVTAGLVEIGQVVSPLYPIAVTHGSAGSVVQVHPEVSGGADRDLLAELEGEFACRLLLQALARVGKTLKRGRQPVSQPHAPPPVAPGPPAARPGGVPAA